MDQRRARKIIVWVSDREHARYLINAARANKAGPDYARGLLCREGGANDNAGSRRIADHELAFARVDALNRLGANIDQLLRIGLRTGYVPDELDGIAAKIDRLLDEWLAP